MFEALKLMKVVFQLQSCFRNSPHLQHLTGPGHPILHLLPDQVTLETVIIKIQVHRDGVANRLKPVGKNNESN